MAFTFSTTKEAAQVQGVKVLVYGKAGSGKTRLCATAPKPIIISAEAGLLSLREYDIPVIKVKSLGDLEDAYHWITTNTKAASFETICLDSISEIGEIVLAAAKLTVKDARQAYGELIEQMMRIIKNFRDLEGKHVYFSAKEAKLVDNVSNTVTFEPDMPGAKLGGQLAYYFDEVFNLNSIPDNTGNIKRILKTSSDFQYTAKDRSGVLAAQEVPDLGKLFEKITGKTTNTNKE